MSYARFSYADVYVFLDCYGALECCGCWLREKDGSVETRFQTTAEMLAHLDAHAAAGHDVPDCTRDGLREDAAENDEWMAKVAAGMCPSCDGTGKCRQPHPDYLGAGCPLCKDTLKCYECGGSGRATPRGQG